MRKKKSVLCAAVLAGMSAILAATIGTAQPPTQPGPPHARNFIAILSGEEEVPPVETDASGLALFRIAPDEQSVSFILITTNIENVTQAHIHVAPKGANGPVIVWLYPEGPPPELIPGVTNGVLAKGVITEDDLVGQFADEPLSFLLDKIRDGETYVNVHTEQFPPGEIRGQIMPVGPPAGAGPPAGVGPPN